MNLRRAAPALFAALCLGLSGLVLRRQIAAHPVPRTAAAPGEPDGFKGFGDHGLSPGPLPDKTWHVAAGPMRRAVLATVGDQLAAIRAGNAERAWSYQSRDLHRNFASAQQFEQMIQSGYPEFGHARSEAFGPVGMDPTGTRAAVTVTVRGENGRLARGYYQLIREDGGYKVAGVGDGRAIK